MSYKNTLQFVTQVYNCVEKDLNNSCSKGAGLFDKNEVTLYIQRHQVFSQIPVQFLRVLLQSLVIH